MLDAAAAAAAAAGRCGPTSMTSMREGTGPPSITTTLAAATGSADAAPVEYRVTEYAMENKY